MLPSHFIMCSILLTIQRCHSKQFENRKHNRKKSIIDDGDTSVLMNKYLSFKGIQLSLSKRLLITRSWTSRFKEVMARYKIYSV